MTIEQKKQLDLVQFTFGSLYFCGTRVESFRGPQLLKVFNDYYMPFIRAGWTVPLAFVLDVCSLLLSGGPAFASRWKHNQVPESLRSIAIDYYKLLRRLRGHPIFRQVSVLVRGTRNAQRRDATIVVFLRFLLAELSEFREIVSFANRQLVLHSCRPTAQAIEDISITTSTGRVDRTRFRFVSPERILDHHVISVLAELMRRIVDYYSEHPLEEFISDEERFMIDYAARSNSSIDRVDYHLLYRVLGGHDVDEPETWPPINAIVEDVVPTESYLHDGQVGGYVDVNLKRLTEATAEILPSEFALRDHPEVMYHKMLNEGLLHYIREDIEQIAPELRVLFYFVIDVTGPMLRASSETHAQLTSGLTPTARAKSLVFELARDVARYFPRENVRADVVLYLWSPVEKTGFRDKFDLFQFDAQRSASRYVFATDLAESMSAFYHYDVRKTDQPEFVRLGEHPYQNLTSMCQERTYHCRHIALFTSRATCKGFLPKHDLNVTGDDHSRDSLWLAHVDLDRHTVGISRPSSFTGIDDVGASALLGQLTEKAFRAQYLEAVLLKAAARRPQTIEVELGGELDE